MKVSRLIPLAGALVVGVAACGDDVTVQQPPAQPAPVIRSVTVSPAAAQIEINRTFQFGANVDADAGATTTVTWSSSNTAVASVNASGLATAGSTAGVTSICATATADASKRGCAQLTVVAGPPVVPASASIQSVTVNCASAYAAVYGCGLNVPAPAPPSPIGGQVDVRVNVNPGSQVVTRVDVLVGDSVMASQTLTADQAAELAQIAAQADGELAAQSSTVATVVLPVNLARFNATNGATTLKNGLRRVSARIFTQQGGTTPVGASNVVELNVLNPNGFIGTVTASGATATDASGFRWRSGALTVTALPVIYEAGVTALAGVQLGFGAGNTIAAIAGCSGGAGGVLPMTFNAASGRWEVTYSNTATTGVRVTNYELNPNASAACASAFNAGGESPSIAVATDGNGNTLTLGLPVTIPTPFTNVTGGAGFLNAPGASLQTEQPFVIRLDNVAPSAPIVNQFAIGRTNNWINNEFNFATRTTSTSALGANPLIRTYGGVTLAGYAFAAGANIGVDQGVSRETGTGFGSAGLVLPGTAPTFEFRHGAAGDANATIDAATPANTPAGVPESQPAAYRTRVRRVDALGNAASSNLLGLNVAGTGGAFVAATNAVAFNFGVDRTKPTASFVNGPLPIVDANSRHVAIGGLNYLFAVGDVPTDAGAQASGFFNIAAPPTRMTYQRRDAVSGTQFFCPTTPGLVAGPSFVGAFQGAGATCANWPDQLTTGATFFRPGNSTTNINVNVGGPTDAYYTLTADVIDQAGNLSDPITRVIVVDGSSPSVAGVLTGSTTNPQLQITATDNLDLQAVSARLNFPMGEFGGLRIQLPRTAISPFNPPTLATSSTQTIPLWRSMEFAAGTGLKKGASDATSPNDFFATSINQANTAFDGPVTPILGGQIAAPACAAATDPCYFQNANWTGTFSIITPAAPVNLSLTGSGGNPVSTTLQARIVGSLSFAQPFNQGGRFYWRDTPFSVWRAFSGTPTVAYEQVGGNNRWTYTLTINAATEGLTSGGVIDVIFIGSNSVGAGGVYSLGTTVGGAALLNVFP